MALNQVALLGRLTRDPEVRSTQTGKQVCSFTVAVRGMTKDQTDFFNIVAWEKTAEFVGRYCRKGQLVAVAGRLSSRKYTDKNGQHRESVEVVANAVDFAEKAERQERAPSDMDELPEGYVPATDGTDDDLPF